MTKASYSITHHEKHIQVIVNDDFNMKDEAHILADKLYDSLTSCEDKAFLAIEVANIKWGFNDVMAAVNLSAKGGNAYLHHPNLWRSENRRK